MPSEILVDELKRKIEQNVVFLLDVRTPEECGHQGVIAGSVNIPLHDLYDKIAEIPKGKEIITICAHGNRSWTAAAILEEKGMKARSLRGGMKAWKLSSISTESEEHALQHAEKKSWLQRFLGK